MAVRLDLGRIDKMGYVKEWPTCKENGRYKRLDMVIHWDGHQLEKPTVAIYIGDISFFAKEEHLSQWLDGDCRIWSFFPV